MLYVTVVLSQLFQALRLFSADGAPLFLVAEGGRLPVRLRKYLSASLPNQRKEKLAGNSMAVFSYEKVPAIRGG